MFAKSSSVPVDAVCDIVSVRTDADRAAVDPSCGVDGRVFARALPLENGGAEARRAEALRGREPPDKQPFTVGWYQEGQIGRLLVPLPGTGAWGYCVSLSLIHPALFLGHASIRCGDDVVRGNSDRDRYLFEYSNRCVPLKCES